MLAEGAAILDIGGQSTRPGAEEIGPDAETAAVVPAIKAILSSFTDAIISVDTFHAGVADAALQAGACMINDVSGGQRDPEIYHVAARYRAPYILMHMRGTPATMQQQTEYGNIMAELLDYFNEKIKLCREAGIRDIIIDPGFGFAKTLEQNYDLLRRLEELSLLQLPVMVGISRKSMLHKLLKTGAELSLNATTAAHMIALQYGARVLRVHDVKEAREAILIWEKVSRFSAPQ